MDAGSACVTRIDGDAECMVVWRTRPKSDISRKDLPFSAVAGRPSHPASHENKGLAGTTHRTLGRTRSKRRAHSYQGLSFFEQGYYDRLGFGTAQYEDWIGFDPALLNVPFPARPPKTIHHRRLRTRMHQSRLASKKTNTAFVTFPDPNMDPQRQMRHQERLRPRATSTKPQTKSHTTSGAATTTMQNTAPTSSNGWLTRPPEQFLELMGIIRSPRRSSPNDQHEPAPPHPDTRPPQRNPSKTEWTTSKSKFATFSRSHRLLAKPHQRPTQMPRKNTPPRAPTTQFNLQLTDPIDDFLPEDETWKSTTGPIHHHPRTRILRDPRHTKKTSQTLKTTTSAFSRMWLGCLRTHIPTLHRHHTSPTRTPHPNRTIPGPSQPQGRDWDF